MKTSIANLQDFTALDPFFRIIEQGLQGFVDPGHFFDLMAEDVVIAGQHVWRQLRAEVGCRSPVSGQEFQQRVL